MREKRVCLLTMPGGILYASPPMGIHRLYGYLIGKKMPVELHDLRIKYWKYMFQKTKMMIFQEKARRILQKRGANYFATFIRRFISASIWTHGKLYPCEYIEPQAQLAKYLMKYSLRDIVDKIKNMKCEDVGRISDLVERKTFWAFENAGDTDDLYLGCMLMSLYYFPTIIKPEGVFPEESPYNSNDICSFINESAKNPMVEFGDKYVAELIEANRYTLAGISVTHESELMPALCLSKRIKERCPQVTIVLGGMQVALMAPKLTQCADLMEPVDYIVSAPAGEKPLEMLIDSTNRSQVEKIPALYYKNGKHFIFTDISNEIDMNHVGTPKYPLEYQKYYYSYPLMTKFSCSWKKCTFCTYNTNTLFSKIIKMKSEYRNLNLVIDDIRAAGEYAEDKAQFKYYIEDSAMDIDRMAELLDQINENKLRANRFSVFMRLDSKLLDLSDRTMSALHKKGLEEIFFGLESGSERIGRMMNKGVELADAEKIIRKVSDNGIKISLGTIIGFPTETHAESQKTLDFVLANGKYLQHVEMNPFRLEKTAKIYRQALGYNVKVWMDSAEDLSLYTKYKLDGTIGSEESVQICNEYNYAYLKAYKPEIQWELLFGGAVRWSGPR